MRRETLIAIMDRIAVYDEARQLYVINEYTVRIVETAYDRYSMIITNHGTVTYHATEISGVDIIAEVVYQCIAD